MVSTDTDPKKSGQVAFKKQNILQLRKMEILKVIYKQNALYKNDNLIR